MFLKISEIAIRAATKISSIIAKNNLAIIDFMSIYFYNKLKIYSLSAKKMKHGAPHCKTWGEVGRLKVYGKIRAPRLFHHRTGNDTEEY